MTETNKKYVRAYNVIVQILSDTKWNNYSKFLIKTKTNLSSVQTHNGRGTNMKNNLTYQVVKIQHEPSDRNNLSAFSSIEKTNSTYEEKISSAIRQ